ncbi:DUF2333 family protein [bacterium]|nr:DUF2333 family protein [bacterium]
MTQERLDEKIEEKEERKEDENLDSEVSEKKKHPFLFRIFIIVYHTLIWLFKWAFKGLKIGFSFMWKHWVASTVTLFVILPTLFTILYMVVETTSFPTVAKSVITSAEQAKSKDEKVKGVVVSQAIYHQLESELDSFFGWSANDLIITPTAWLDNRSNRQQGVIFATMMLESFFSTQVAKYGKGEDENSHLKSVRTTYFVFQPTKFWLPASESQYRKGIALMKQYEGELTAGKATYNLRSDDMYTLFKLLISEEFLGEPLGRLSSESYSSFTTSDDAIFYAQGVVLVVRDVVRTIYTLYPNKLNKGSIENFEKAFKEMDSIASFNPMLVMSGNHDSMLPDHRAKAATYLFNLIERLRDIASSINR